MSSPILALMQRAQAKAGNEGSDTSVFRISIGSDHEPCYAYIEGQSMKCYIDRNDQKYKSLKEQIDKEAIRRGGFTEDDDRKRRKIQSSKRFDELFSHLTKSPPE